MFKLRKIASALASTLMVGSTIGLAAAGSYPAPFVQGGNANVAIVYGANAAATDLASVANIQTDLSEALAAQTAQSGGSGGTSSSVTGGDYVLIAKSSDKLNLGDYMNNTFGNTVDSDDLPTLLADGTYMNEENTEYAYEQSFSLQNLRLVQFADSDYEEKEPTIGFQISSSSAVLNYTLDFTTDAESDAVSTGLEDFETSDIEIMGKSYYVLDAQNGTNAAYLGKMTLLDAANTAIVSEGDTSTVTVGDKSYDVSINFISASSVKLEVDGQVTNSLTQGATYRLPDGTYIGIKDILVQDYAGGVKKVEFSIGSGKLEIEAGQEIELNDKDIDGMKGWLVRGTAGSGTKQTLSKIIIEWSTDDESFITDAQSLEMPGFGAVKFSMGGFIKPAQEVVKVDYDGEDSIELTIPVKDGETTLNILYANASGYFEGIGKEATDLLATTSGTSLGYIERSGGDDYHTKFVATYKTTSDAESYILSAKVTQDDSGRNVTTIQNEVTGENVCANLKVNDDCDIGDVTLTVSSASYSAADRNVTFAGGSNVNFNTIYTKEGLALYLPYVAANNTGAAGAVNFTGNTASPGTTGHDGNTFVLTFVEEDKDEDKLEGSTFNVTVGHDSDGDVHITDIATLQTEHKVLGTDNDVVSTVYSDLATQVKRLVASDKGAAEITYSGAQAYAEVYLAQPAAEVTPGSSGSSDSGTSTGTVKKLGSVMTTDANAASVSGKNLIVVGGSCVNTVAAELLGVQSPTCGADWQAATNVGSGQYLIETFDRAEGTVATLVAGFNAQDTTNAASYLMNEAVKTESGVKYIGTTATSAELQTSTATDSTA